MADLPKPVAQVQRMGSYQGVPAYGCLLTIESEKRLKVNDPLFSQAEMDAYAAAKVAEERERLIREVAALHMAQSVNNQNHPRAWHDGVDAALDAIRGTEAASRGE